MMPSNKILLSVVLSLFSFAALADPGTEEFLRQQERRRQLQERLVVPPEVRLQEPVERAEGRLREDERPCFAVDSVALSGESSAVFQADLRRALKNSGFRPGMCLGAEGVGQLLRWVQSEILASGWTTTRVLAPTQNLTSGQVDLVVVPGKIRRIRFVGVDNPATWQGNVARTQFFRNEFPMAAGDLLNVHDLETALENLRRLSSVSADFSIVPTDQADESEVVVDWRQSFPLHLTLSVDDSGSKWTGKSQGTVSLAWENPFGLSDLFYAWRSHDLGHKKSLADTGGKHYESGTEGYGFHYSVPIADWLLSYQFSHSEYRQAVAGAFTPYLYSGWTDEQSLVLSRLLYRDARRKSKAGIGVWSRNSRNYIDDAELDIQHRRTAGWLFNLEHHEYLGEAILRMAVQYKRGTGANRSTEAPEEEFNEGTSRMRIVTGDISLGWPFRLGGQTFSWSSALHLQSNRTPLIPQDRLSIGSRFTVRGFDGETTLMAERGYYWRNELAWHYWGGQQVYLLWDAGQVRGPSAEWLSGSYLEGAGLGLRGELRHAPSGGRLYYDLFVAHPLKAPDAFPDNGTVAGFSVSLRF
jgi:hemolysin activation/secretion protein